jgi:DNA polymerase III delta subunit
MSAAPATPPFTPDQPLPPTLLLGATARCLLDEMVERCLAPVKASAEILRVPAAAFAKDKESGGLAPAVLAQLGNVSLFGAPRVVVVLNGQELLRDKLSKAWIEKPTPRAFLVIATVRSVRDGLPAVAAGLPVVSLWEPGPQSPSELRRFLERRAKERGATLAPDAFDALLAQAGSSLDVLDAELEKLALYRLGETIAARDVEALCGHTAGRDFDLLWRALRAGRAGEALALLETMGEEGLLMFGGGRLYGRAAIANALLPMLLARIRRAAAVGVNDEKLVAAVGTALEMKPGYVRFLQEDARSLGPRLTRWQAAAIAAEVAQKRVGSRSDLELLERLLLELARTR